jgi:hypothetical protein
MGTKGEGVSEGGDAVYAVEQTAQTQRKEI